MIYYTLFSINKIFDDARLNVFFNQFFTFLINIYNEDRIIYNLVLDGKLALLLQEERSTPGFTKMEVSTNDIELFKFLSTSSRSLDIKNYKVNNQILELELKSGYFVYINYKKEKITAVDYAGIKIRTKTEIK